MPTSRRTRSSRAPTPSRVRAALAFVAGALLAVGCDHAATPPPPPAVAVPRAAPSVVALGELEYRLEGFDGYPVPLHAGRYQAPPELPDAERVVASAELHRFSAIGDLDGDGSADAAVVVVADGGGSGVFHELVAVLNRADGLQATLSLPLGDRIELRGIEVREGRVLVDLLGARPDDPACCPSQRLTRRYKVSEGRLVEAERGTSL